MSSPVCPSALCLQDTGDRTASVGEIKGKQLLSGLEERASLVARWQQGIAARGGDQPGKDRAPFASVLL